MKSTGKSFFSSGLKLLAVFLFLAFGNKALATHNRAGEITYRNIDPNNCNTFEITVTTYTKTGAVDRCELTIFFGDGDSCVAQRVNGLPPSAGGCPFSANPQNCNACGEYLPNEVKKNIYRCVHTYSGPGEYIISMYDENRNQGVVNITNSVNVPFYIESKLVINPISGCNSSPQLLNPPIDNACVGICFFHNAGAYDPDGDSLGYRIVPCKGTLGLPIPNNPGPYNVQMNANTGDFEWCVPSAAGEYNFAFVIEEWRFIPAIGEYVLVGEVLRDMQITVMPGCENQPPEIQAEDELCVVAGTQVEFIVTATDADMDMLTLTASGGPLLVSNQATFPQPAYGQGSVQRTFRWNTACNNVQLGPHLMYFRVEDDGGPNNVNSFRIATYKTTKITVVGPAPIITLLEPIGSTMRLEWQQSVCSEVVRYDIYRHIGFTGWIPDECETGVPAYTGYSLIGSVQGLSNTVFIDNNGGLGLVSGVQYCYRVVAIFPDGAKSYSSTEECASLKKDIPIITNVSVINTDVSIGSDTIIWSKPTELDLVAFKGPYEYNLYRSEGLNGSSFEKIWSNSYADFELMNDSIYVDNGLNTEEKIYTYKIELVNKTPNQPSDTIGNTKATSVFLNTIAGDNQITLTWTLSVPWTNYKTHIFRKLETELEYSYLGETPENIYVDTGLANGTQVCYLIRTEGTYSSPAIDSLLINTSQISCDSPIDTIPPCQPPLSVIPSCDNFENQLSWVPHTTECNNEALYFKIYYTPTFGGNWQLLHTTNDVSTTNFLHADLLSSIAGCYAITGIDSFNNESLIIDSVCVDNCPIYQLPNTFTPDGDGFNESFGPFEGWRFIKSAETTIYNRWGLKVFESNDPAIGWNGKINNTGPNCTEGIYFYVCNAKENRLYGEIEQSLKGFIVLFRNSKGGGF